MPKSLHCHRQPEASRKRYIPSVNNQPIVDIFQKFYENGPCIQNISFLVTMINCIKLLSFEKSKFSHLDLVSRFLFVSNATNFFIHSLKGLVLKKPCLYVAGFLQLGALPSLNMQIYPFIARTLDCEENLFDFYVESIAFRIKIHKFNLIINDSRLYTSNIRIDIYLDQIQSIKQ